MKTYRPGGIGAMMDEYERAAADLRQVLSSIDEVRFEQIINEKVDEHTRSIQAIMRHVVNSGYGYANYLRKLWEIPVTSPQVVPVPRDEAISALQTMLTYTAETLAERWTMSEEEADKMTFVVSWGVLYSVEQLLEHAIVHILRHRRQIERVIAT